MKSDIQVYPTTQILDGTETVEDYLNAIADELYDTYVCDFRFRPEDLHKLVDLAIERRKQNERLHN